MARSARGGGARDDREAFDQRRYHPLVVGHARPMFLRGEYPGAVSGAHRAMEGLIRKKSGIGGHGNALICGALGEGGALEVGPPGLPGGARAGMRRRLMQVCMAVASGVRNPIAHEADIRIGREEALRMLGEISYICGQVERARRGAGPGRRPPEGGGARHRAPVPKGGGALCVRKAGGRATGAYGHGAARGQGGRAARRRTLLGLPWLQSVGIIAGIATRVITALAALFR